MIGIGKVRFSCTALRESQPRPSRACQSTADWSSPAAQNDTWVNWRSCATWDPCSRSCAKAGKPERCERAREASEQMSLRDRPAESMGARLITDVKQRGLRGATLLKHLSAGCMCGRLTHLSFEGGLILMPRTLIKDRIAYDCLCARQQRQRTSVAALRRRVTVLRPLQSHALGGCRPSATTRMMPCRQPRYRR